MNENMENRSELLVKWLRVLMYIAIVSLVNSIVDFVPFVPAALTTWVSRGIMLAMVVCMFQLAPVNGRYRKAGIFRAVMLACALITSFLFGSTLLTLAASLFSILAVYQEYCAHSELVSEIDPRLSGKWHTLFNWGIVTTLLLSFGTTVTAVILVLMNPDVDAGIVSGIAIGLLTVPQFIIDVVYLRYLKKMIDYFQEEVYSHDA